MPQKPESEFRQSLRIPICEYTMLKIFDSIAIGSDYQITQENHSTLFNLIFKKINLYINSDVKECEDELKLNVERIRILISGSKYDISMKERENLLLLCFHLSVGEHRLKELDVVWQLLIDKQALDKIVLYMRNVLGKVNYEPKQIKKFLERIILHVAGDQTILFDQTKIYNLRLIFNSIFDVFSTNKEIRSLFWDCISLKLIATINLNLFLESISTREKKQEIVTIIKKLLYLGINVEFQRQNYLKVINLERLVFLVDPEEVLTYENSIRFAVSYMESMSKKQTDLDIQFELKVRSHLHSIQNRYEVFIEIDDVGFDVNLIKKRLQDIKDLFRVLDYGDDGSAGVLKPKQPALL